MIAIAHLTERIIIVQKLVYAVYVSHWPPLLKCLIWLHLANSSQEVLMPHEDYYHTVMIALTLSHAYVMKLMIALNFWVPLPSFWLTLLTLTWLSLATRTSRGMWMSSKLATTYMWEPRNEVSCTYELVDAITVCSGNGRARITCGTIL